MTTADQNTSTGEAEAIMHGKLHRAWCKERLFWYLNGIAWLAVVFAIVVVAHYVVSYDRIAWLVRQ